MLYADDHIEVEIPVIMRRDIADFLAILCSALFFAMVFINVKIAARYLREIQNVGVFFFDIARSYNHELTVVFVDQDLCASAEGACNVEFFNLLLVCFAVCELLLDLLYRAVSAVVKPVRKLSRAVFTEVAVFQFSVSGKVFNARSLYEYVSKSKENVSETTGFSSSLDTGTVFETTRLSILDEQPSALGSL